MAVDRVEKRLRKVTAALDAAGIPYAVIGGNAVACWVGRVDTGATRATKDVDLLVNRADSARIDAAMALLGFSRHDMRRLVLYVDPEEPSKRSGVHLVWADEKVRPSYACPAPTLDEAVRDPEGFLVLDLAALVRMKLTSYRLVDQMHIVDLSSVGLLSEAVRSSLPQELLERLATIERTIEE
jgi:hypothetical protein